MELLITKIICLTTIIVVISLDKSTAQQDQYVGNNILDIDPPKFYILNPSPLRNRDSLRQEQYFSFLNTLYRNDRSKSSLFENRQPEATNNNYQLQNLHRARRSTAPLTASSTSQIDTNRQKRAIVFRPLFVYRQQEVKKQRLAEQRRRRYKKH